MPAHKSIAAGTRFHKLVVLGPSEQSLYGNKKFLCQCDCGLQSHVSGSRLRAGLTKSCGCMARDPVVRKSQTHGRCYSPSYYTYQTMKSRCMTPTNSNYPKYGGRGIKVCDRWVASFENFLADMGERPAGRTLDRIDNDGPYSPENCRWATKREQQNNMRTNRLIRVGSEMMTLSNAARAMGMREGVLRSRLWLGWSEDRALNQPVQRRYRSLPVDPTP